MYIIHITLGWRIPISDEIEICMADSTYFFCYNAFYAPAGNIRIPIFVVKRKRKYRYGRSGEIGTALPFRRTESAKKSKISIGMGCMVYDNIARDANFVRLALAKGGKFKIFLEECDYFLSAYRICIPRIGMRFPN